jgi:hypothetical protein
MATKKPAESMDGTTETFRTDFSGAPGCGTPAIPPDEQPAAVSATTALTVATRSHLPLPDTEYPFT